MKKKFKSKLIPYITSLKSNFGLHDLKMQILQNKDLKLLSLDSAEDKTILWVSGFGEREFFFLSFKKIKKDIYYGFVKDSCDIKTREELKQEGV